MPTMPRTSRKLSKIAYNILGVPANIASKRSSVDKKINKRLIFEESVRVR